MSEKTNYVLEKLWSFADYSYID